MGVLEALHKALLDAEHVSDKATHARLDARNADRDAKISEKLFGPQVQGIINTELQKRTQGENTAATQGGAPSGGQLPDLMPTPAKIEGDDMGHR